MWNCKLARIRRIGILSTTLREDFSCFDELKFTKLFKIRVSAQNLSVKSFFGDHHYSEEPKSSL